jgi:hypothetical protein
MSYKRAWLHRRAWHSVGHGAVKGQHRFSSPALASAPARLLDSMNQAFTEPVVTAAPGGSGGGGATLTPFGAEVLERYRSVHERAAAMAVDDLAALARRARPDAGPKI